LSAWGVSLGHCMWTTSLLDQLPKLGSLSAARNTRESIQPRSPPVLTPFPPWGQATELSQGSSHEDCRLYTLQSPINTACGVRGDHAVPSSTELSLAIAVILNRMF